MRRVFVLFLSLALASPIANAQSARTNLPSMNYWDLSAQVVQSEQLRDHLDVSPLQAKQINELRKDDELNSIVMIRTKMVLREEKLRELNAIDENRGAIETLSSIQIRQRVLNELEPTIKRKLREVLSNEQLEALRLFAMKEKYGNGFSAFGSQEVAEYCGFLGTDLLRTTLKEKAKLDELRFDAASASLQRSALTLPPNARMKYAYYFGPEHFPDIQITREMLEQMANAKFPVRGNAVCIDALATYPPSQLRLGVSESQINAMRRLKEGLEIELNDLHVPAPPGKMDAYHQSYHAIHRKYEERAASLLTPTQKLKNDQLSAFGEYRINPMAPLGRAEFVAFLELSPNELKTALTIAHLEKVTLESDYKTFAKSCFMAISNEIEPTAKGRLHELFTGVFD